MHQSESSQNDLSIQPVRCMGVCDRDCVIAFVGSGKFTHLFGDLPSDDACLEATVSVVLDCEKQYCVHAKGALPYRERPEQLRDTIIAKIPSFPLEIA